MEAESLQLTAEQFALREKFYAQYNSWSARGGSYRPAFVQPWANGRPVAQMYHEGYLRQVYTDTWELVPLPRDPYWYEKLPTPKKGHKKKVKGPAQPPSNCSLLFQRDKGCVRCGTTNLLLLTKHHVVHRFYGGTGHLDNLQLLCRSCHQFVHNVLKLPSGVRVTFDPNASPYVTKHERKFRMESLVLQLRGGEEAISPGP